MPTADTPVVTRSGFSWPRFLGMLTAIATICGLGVWLIPQTPEGTWLRGLAWAAVPIVTFVTVRLIRGPRSGKLLRR